MIGEHLGNYRILAKLGQGGMGAVYLGNHELMGRRAAIKVLLPELCHHPAVVRRLFNEARATATLRHPALVPVYDCGVHEATGSAYIIMEYLEGETLARRIARWERLSVGTAVAFATQIAEGMAVAHEAGIIHRDLKPDNIFLVAHPARDEDTVRIIDFGVAKLTDAAASSAATGLGVVLGTPSYLAPEQAQGSHDIDGRADVYSIGCILYAMLCGRPPFVYGNVAALIAAHLNERPVSPRRLVPGIPPALDALILTALAKEPDQRYPDMRALAVALDGLGVEPPLPRSSMLAVGEDLESNGTIPLARSPHPAAPYPSSSSGEARPVSYLGPRSPQPSGLRPPSPAPLPTPHPGSGPISNPGATKAMPLLEAMKELAPVDTTLGKSAGELTPRARVPRPAPAPVRKSPTGRGLFAAITLASLLFGGLALWRALDLRQEHKQERGRATVQRDPPPSMPPPGRSPPPFAPSVAPEPTPEPDPAGTAALPPQSNPPETAPPAAAPPAAARPIRRRPRGVTRAPTLVADEVEPELAPRRPPSSTEPYVHVGITNPPDRPISVTVDGKRSHLPLRLPNDGQVHTIKFLVPGHQLETHQIRADRDQDITLELKPVLILD